MGVDYRSQHSPGNSLVSHLVREMARKLGNMLRPCCELVDIVSKHCSSPAEAHMAFQVRPEACLHLDSSNKTELARGGLLVVPVQLLNAGDEKQELRYMRMLSKRSQNSTELLECLPPSVNKDAGGMTSPLVKGP